MTHDITTVQPGDTVIFETGGRVYGGRVWRMPSGGDLVAGDTFLTVNGEWLPSPSVIQITRPHIQGATPYMIELDEVVRD